MDFVSKKAKSFFLFCKLHPVVDLIFILLVGLHILSGLRGNLLYIGGDTGIPLNPINNLYLLYPWQNQQGGIVWWNLTSVFIYTFFAFFEILGFSLAVIQRFYIYFAHTLAGLSMYYLVTSFSLEKKRITAITAAIFYMFSPFLINYLGIFVFLPHTVVPLILGLFVRGLSRKMNRIKSVLFITLAFFGIIINLPNYSMYFVALLLMALYAIFYVITTRGEFWHLVKFVFILSVLTVLLSLWFVLPYLSLLSQTGVAGQLRNVSVASTIEGFGDYGYSTLLQLIRLFGAAGFMAGGATYSLSYIHNPFLIFISYLIPLFAFGAILLKPKSKEVLFFSIVSIVFIFLAKGVNPPLGALHFWAVTHIPLARTFRTTWNLSLGASIGYAFLIGVATASIVDRLQKQRLGSLKSAGAVILITAVIMTNTWPLVTGDYFTYKWNPPSFEGVRVPKAYYELDDFLTKDRKEDSRFLKIPSSWGMIETNWGYRGADPFCFIFSKPFITGYSIAGFARQINRVVYNLFDQTMAKDMLGREKYGKILTLLNVRYIILDGYDKDSKNLSIYKNTLNILGIQHLKDIGKFSVYKVLNNYFLPHIYLVGAGTYMEGGINDLLSLVTLDDFQIENGIFFSRFLKNRQKRFILSKSNEKFITNTPAIVKSKGKEYAVDNYVVPEKGRYEILVKAKNELKNKGLKALSLKMNEASVVSKAPLFRPDSWVSLGDFSFKKGKHRLSLYAVDKKGKETRIKGAYIVLRKSKPANSIPPRITFKKINPTKYMVKVEKAAKPFFLIFSESFHSGWKAYIREANGQRPEVGGWRSPVWETWFRKPLPENRHFLVNGYANAWHIDPAKVDKDGDGKFAVTLYFWPQSLFYLGLGISLITLIGCVAYLTTPLITRKTQIARRTKH